MKSLILGSSGFLGKHLTQKLLELGHQVTCFDISHTPMFANAMYIDGFFSKETNFEKLVHDHDIVFHLISSSFPNSTIPYEQEISENVFATLKLMEACVKQPGTRLVFISSGGTVYGQSKKGVPFNEQDETTPIASYGIQKLMIEKYLHLFHHQYGLDFKVVRLANPYGPGQNPKGAVGAIAVLLDRAKNDEVITIFGDGSSVRDYIYIDDAIQGLVNIALSETSEKVVNLGGGQGTSLTQVLESIQKVTGKSLTIDYLPQRSTDVDFSVLDITLYSKLFPKHTMVTLEQGISSFYSTMIKGSNKNES